MDILKKILETKRAEVEKAKTRITQNALLSSAQALRPTVNMRESLEAKACGIIAEFKRKSPSKGFIYENAPCPPIVKGYAESGAGACSILTDEHYFGGSLCDLMMARKEVALPLLRKDFVIDFYQIAEARACGADAILLIAAALSRAQCAELAECARGLNLQTLLEIHSYDELKYANPFIDMLGVNNRNLSTFETEIKTSLDLSKYIPKEFLKVSESGISSMNTVRMLQESGYRAFLIGENFMRTDNPARALKDFLAS